MAGKIVGITIDIAGKTSGLVSSLKDADSALSKTNSALKSVNSALKFDGNNVDLLTSKSQLLGEAIAQNSTKLDVLKATAEKAMETLGQEGGTTTEQMAELQAEISRTEQTLAGLETEAANTSAALEDMSSEAPEDMAELSDASEETADSLEEVETESENTSVSLDALAGVAAATGAAMAAAFAAAVDAAKEVGQALISATVDAGNYADELHTLESVTGISTERLQEMDYALGGLIDVSMETVTGSLKKLTKGMESAAEKQEAYNEKHAELLQQYNEGALTYEEYTAQLWDAEDAYSKLGVSVTDADGNLKDSETLFWDVIDAASEMADGTLRDALLMDILGKSATDLNPLIEAGSDGFRELAEEAHNVGYVMDEDTLDSFQNFDDQMERLGKGATAAKNALGTVLLPTLSGLAGSGTDLLNKFTVKVQESGGDISKIGDAVEELLPELFAGINQHLPEIFGLIGSVTETLGQILIDNLPMLLDSALQIVTTLTDGLLSSENIEKIITAALGILLKLTEYLISNLSTVVEAALQIVLAVVQGITDSLPELIPVAVDAVLTIVETLTDPETLSQLLDAALQLILALATGLVDSLPEIIARLPEIIEGIVSFLTGDALPDIIDAGITLLLAIAEDTPTIIAGLIEALAKIIGDMVLWITGDGAADLLGGFSDAFLGIIDAAYTWGADLIQHIIDGIGSVASDLWGCVEDIAGGIADFLGFSVPKKGPLAEWGINNPGADMVDLFSEGIDDELPELQNSIDLMAGTIATGSVPTSPNYSGQLDSINGSIGALAAASGQPIVVNAYFGTEHFGTMVANANAENMYITGGR